MITAVHICGHWRLSRLHSTVTVCTMVLADELQAVAVQAQAAAAKQGDTVRSLKASLKDGKADKVSVNTYVYTSCLYMSRR